MVNNFFVFYSIIRTKYMRIVRNYKSLESRVPLKDAREVFAVKEDPLLVARMHDFDLRVAESLRVAVENSQWNFRTIGSLALETGLSKDNVAQMLHSTPTGRESPLRNHNGEKLYRGSESKMSKGEIYEMIRRILAKDF
jgi:hypothetical protein